MSFHHFPFSPHSAAYPRGDPERIGIPIELEIVNSQHNQLCRVQKLFHKKDNANY